MSGASPISPPPTAARTLKREKLIAARKRVPLTQKALAERIGVAQTTVSRWEGGFGEPGAPVYAKLASELKVTEDELSKMLT